MQKKTSIGYSTNDLLYMPIASWATDSMSYCSHQLATGTVREKRAWLLGGIVVGIDDDRGESWRSKRDEQIAIISAVSLALRTSGLTTTTRLLLVAPNLDKEFRVEADTSNFATGGILSIKCKDNRWRPVAYISKSLNEMECNYEIHNKEMLAVIRCLEAWRHFLEGAKEKFEIWLDHKNLEYFMSNQKLNR